MKFIIAFILSINIYGQTAEQLREMLNGGSFQQYEKMFESIIKDMEDFDRSQFDQYNKLFDQSIMNQLQLLGGQRKSYEWKENKDERILSFVGRLDESASPSIEIKDEYFKIKGEFVNDTNYNGHRNISKIVMDLKIYLPRDVEASKVRYENKVNSFLVIFPKKDVTNNVKKPLRSPLKENKSDITI